MLPVIAKTLIRKDKERAFVCGHLVENIFGCCLAFVSPLHVLSICFAPQPVKLIHDDLCFLNGQIDIAEA